MRCGQGRVALKTAEAIKAWGHAPPELYVQGLLPSMLIISAVTR